MAFILPDLINGAINTGIAASNDVFNDSNQMLAFSNDVSDTKEAVTWAAQRIQFTAGWTDMVKGMMIRACNFIIRKSLMSDDVRVDKTASIGVINTDENLKKYYDAAPPLERVVTLLYATKVNFVMLNHHVGTDPNQVVGYAGKVLRAWQMDREEGIREALWIIGHWMSTKQALFDMGYPDLTEVNSKIVDLNISEDMKMRINGGIAGGAKFFVYRAIYEKLAASYYGIVCSIELPKTTMDNMFESMRSTPLKYHIGSVYLTGVKQVNSDIWTSEDKITLAAFVHAIIPNDTLAHSPTILKQGEVASSEVYARFSTLKIAMIKSASAEVALELIKSKSIGGSCLWVRNGRITEQEIEDAKKRVDDAEKKKKEAEAAKG